MQVFLPKASAFMVPIFSVGCMIVTCFLGPSIVLADRKQELGLTSEDSKQIDPFEGHQLKQADANFKKKNYLAAQAAYQGFTLEFPKSKAIPYALYRRARALQLANKRLEAIEVYQEVSDRFPDSVPYVAAALLYLGEAHMADGDTAKAIAVWERMTQTEQFLNEPVAAPAFNHLGTALQKAGKPTEAVSVFRIGATKFRKSNSSSAQEAIQKIIDYYVQQCDEPALVAFYKEVSGFNDVPLETPPIKEDRGYWLSLIEAIPRNAPEVGGQADNRKTYFAYWSERMAGKYPDWEDFQVAAIEFDDAANRDRSKRIERLQKVFESGPSNNDRVIRWLKLSVGVKEKQALYFSKLDFGSLTLEQAHSLLRLCLDELKSPEFCASAIKQLPLERYSDEEKLGLVETVRENVDCARSILVTLRDGELGLYQQLRLYYNANDFERGLEIADRVIAMPKYASEANFIKGDMLFSEGKYTEALVPLRQSEKQPAALWRVADCYVKLGNISEAISYLQEVERFLQNHAPEASLRMAYAYREVGKQTEYIAALRAVLKKYPKSKQSSTAHQNLERLGLRIGGGIDVDE